MTTTNVKQLRGTKRPCRDDKAEVKAAVMGLEAPAWLTEGAESIWNLVAPIMVSEGIATSTDTLSLGQLCEHFSIWKKAIRNLEVEGLIMDTAGTRAANPNFMVASKCLDSCQKILATFGLNPTARNKITKVITESPNDPWARF